MLTERNRYRVYLSTDDKSSYDEIWLSSDIQLSPERERGEMFYRWKAQSEWVLDRGFRDENNNLKNDTVFDTLAEMFYDRTYFTQEINVKIVDDTDSSVVWEGYFGILAAEMDLDAGTIRFKPNPDDEYRSILEHKDDEIDVIAGLQDYQPYAAVDAETLYQLGFTTEDPPQHNIHGHEIDQEIYKLCGQITHSDNGGSGDYDWLIEAEGLDHYTYYWMWQTQRIKFEPLGSSGWIPKGNYWYYKDCEVQTIKVIEFENFHSFEDTTQYLLDEMNSEYDIGSYTYVSNTFLNSDDGGSANPVTGIDPNPLSRLLIAQKSDVKDPDASNKATIGMISFDDLMEIYKNLFNSYWFIDDSGNFRIEHITYWEDEVGIDLTDDTKYDPLTVASIQNFKHESFVNYEKWEFMEGDNSDEGYRAISYDIGIEERNERIFRLPKLTTDIEYIANNKESIADDGFVLVVVDSLSNPHIKNRQVPPYSTKKVNGSLMAGGVMDDYFRWERPVLFGTMWKDDLTTFHSEERHRVQGTVSFKRNDTDGFDPDKLIKVKFVKYDGSHTTANGEVKKAVWNLSTDWVEVTLAFDNDMGSETYKIKINDIDCALTGMGGMQITT